MGLGDTFFSVNLYAGSLIHFPVQGVSSRPVSKVSCARAVSPASSSAVRAAV